MAEIRTPRTRRTTVVLALEIDGTGTASIVNDKGDVTLTDNGTGDYTLTYLEPWPVRPIVTANAISDAGVIVGTVEDTTSTTTAVRLNFYTTTSGAAVDCKFGVQIVGEVEPY